MKLDIVIPIYNEEENLGELQRRLRDVCSRIEGCDWQVLYVNDGSADRSLSIMLEQHQADPQIHGPGPLAELRPSGGDYRRADACLRGCRRFSWMGICRTPPR